MNELTVFSKDVIPVYTTDTGEKVVLGRELHERLGITTRYNDWLPRMAEYGFTENEDFYSFLSKTMEGGRPAVEHLLKLDMAKHIAMIQRSAEGKAIRDKLIQLETDVTSLSPELQCLIRLELHQKQQDKQLADVNQRIDDIREVVALNPSAWREDARRLIVQIARKWGGNEFIKDVNAEVFRLLDARGGVSLATRLTNKRQRLADEGVCKSKRERLSKVDIIAEDKKLIEIYLAIVKEMAVQNGVAQKTA